MREGVGERETDRGQGGRKKEGKNKGGGEGREGESKRETHTPREIHKHSSESFLPLLPSALE